MANPKTYHGSCECEKVRIEATFDLSQGTFKCNCRMCGKGRFWGAGMPPENFKIVAGEAELSRYSSNPMHHFCKHCGIKMFGRVEMPDGTKQAVVAVAVLDDLDPRALVAAPIHYCDGRHDRFDRKPEYVEHL